MVKDDPLFTIKAYDIASLEDELRVDSLCKELLKEYHFSLLNDKLKEPLIAGSMARGADYFLRDFMIDRQQKNIFHISPELIKGFAGNWYIVNNIDPSINELTEILAGIHQFYEYSCEEGLISENKLTVLATACQEHDYYKTRIEDFFTIKDDGYLLWKKECPVP